MPKPEDPESQAAPPCFATALRAWSPPSERMKGDAMKFSKVLLLLISLILMSASGVLAQNSPGAAQTAENLRAQLLEVQAEEAKLQDRVQQLDSDLKPENIERYFAVTGSTRPEELREQRRRQLQKEKDRVLARLEQLAASRARLESAITTADAEAYRQSAQDPVSRQVNQMLGEQYLNTVRLMVGVLVFIAITGAWAFVAIIRRRRSIA